MPVNITTKPPEYFMTANAEQQRPTISELEVSGLFNPKFIGRVIAEKMDRTSIVAQLIAQNREMTVTSDQIVWKEEDEYTSVNKVTGVGLVTRAGNNFTINSSAIPVDAYDIDSNRPTEAQWIVGEGMGLVVFDTTGEENHGVITAISADKKTIKVTPVGEGVTDWTVALTNLDVIFTTYNLDHCECAPCIGYRRYAPTRENTMAKDGECVEYCEETLAIEGEGGYDRFEMKDGAFMNLDQRLTDKQKIMLERMEYNIAFGRKITRAQATALGKVSLGMDGIFTTLENRALKFQGMVDSMVDLFAITTELKKKGVMSATMKCTDVQFAKLMNLVPPTSPYFIDPFKDNTESIYYVGLRGVDLNGVRILFKEWSALDMTSENIGKKYNYVIIPEGELTKVINGKREKVGYLEMVWFEAFGKVYKWLRDKKGEESNCGSKKVDYLSKYTIALFHPEKWIVGMNV